MEQGENGKLPELRSLIAAIRAASFKLRDTALSEEEAREESEIFSEFDAVVHTQAFSTLNNLVNYQLYGWRELTDGCGTRGDGADPD